MTGWDKLNNDINELDDNQELSPPDGYDYYVGKGEDPTLESKKTGLYILCIIKRFSDNCTALVTDLKLRHFLYKLGIIYPTYCARFPGVRVVIKINPKNRTVEHVQM